MPPWFCEKRDGGGTFQSYRKRAPAAIRCCVGASIPIGDPGEHSPRAGVDGLTPADEVPHALTADEASAAATVFAFDEVPSDRKGNATVTYWRNVPPASKDYSAARDAIVRRVEEAAASLRRGRR